MKCKGTPPKLEMAHRIQENYQRPMGQKEDCGKMERTVSLLKTIDHKVIALGRVFCLFTLYVCVT